MKQWKPRIFSFTDASFGLYIQLRRRWVIIHTIKSLFSSQEQNLIWKMRKWFYVDFLYFLLQVFLEWSILVQNLAIYLVLHRLSAYNKLLRNFMYMHLCLTNLIWIFKILLLSDWQILAFNVVTALSSLLYSFFVVHWSWNIHCSRWHKFCWTYVADRKMVPSISYFGQKTVI
jgi:hypothetical protein